MNEYEKLEREALKTLLKMSVMNNPKLNEAQKQIAIERIERAAAEAEWIMELLKQGGFLDV